mmetsp:Transcript_52638/g.133023  ORF Transcript_52638/g.133023 Transcript_52638/m.133023 type:complete len:204 (-) Transcript_52638:8-619(-)
MHKGTTSEQSEPWSSAPLPKLAGQLAAGWRGAALSTEDVPSSGTSTKVFLTLYTVGTNNFHSPAIIGRPSPCTSSPSSSPSPSSSCSASCLPPDPACWPRRRGLLFWVPIFALVLEQKAPGMRCCTKLLAKAQSTCDSNSCTLCHAGPKAFAIAARNASRLATPTCTQQCHTTASRAGASTNCRSFLGGGAEAASTTLVRSSR